MTMWMLCVFRLCDVSDYLISSVISSAGLVNYLYPVILVSPIFVDFTELLQKSHVNLFISAAHPHKLVLVRNELGDDLPLGHLAMLVKYASVDNVREP